MKKIIKQITTNSELETKKLARTFARKLKKGDIVGLIGELGSGKTIFTKGIADGMGIKELVTSPSFSILNIYQSKHAKLFHFDLYRLNSKEEFENIGYEEYFEGEGISIIEWADKCMDVLPLQCYLINFDYINKNKRRIAITQK